MNDDYCSKEDIALIYGIMLGDGCLSKVGDHHYFFEICGHIEDDLDFLEKIKPIVEQIRGRAVKIKKRPTLGKLEMGFSDKKVFLFFKSIGFPVGKKGTNVAISQFFTERSYKHIIKGYFATDGSLVLTNNNGTLYPRIEFSSISKSLLTQTLVYLNKNGMNGNLYVSHKAKRNWNTLYRIQFNGQKNLLRFSEIVGFFNPKHQRKFEYYKKIKNGGDGL